MSRRLQLLAAGLARQFSAGEQPAPNPDDRALGALRAVLASPFTDDAAKLTALLDADDRTRFEAIATGGLGYFGAQVLDSYVSQYRANLAGTRTLWRPVPPVPSAPGDAYLAEACRRGDHLYFAVGECFAFALALAEQTGWELMIRQPFFHVLALHPSGLHVDVHGLWPRFADFDYYRDIEGRLDELFVPDLPALVRARPAAARLLGALE